MNTLGTPANPSVGKENLRRAIYAFLSFLLFIFALDLMISSLQHLGKNAVETIILATSNPFTGLFIGLLITALIQSSSTTTAMVVALVASNSITLSSAMPIIMGANIGTTITSTIVSLGFISKRKEFQRAVAAGSFHDFFNILTALVLFPLEYYYGFLSSLSIWFSGLFYTAGSSPTNVSGTHYWMGFDSLVKFFIDYLPGGILLVVFSFGLLFLSIILFRKIISSWLMASSPEKFSRFFFKSNLKSFLWGLATTAAIRSSTITTSVVVPIVAKKITSLKKAAPFILGANLGTTVTAFIAAFMQGNTNSAISIAIAHFLFNLIGILLFAWIPIIKELPLRLSNSLGRYTLRYRLSGIVYILMMFFIIPFSLIYLNRGKTEVLRATYQKEMGDGIPHHIRVVTRASQPHNKGEWLTYLAENEDPEAAPDQLFTSSKKNNILFLGKDMYMFNHPGQCWDGVDERGKYQTCIEAIHPTFVTGTNLTFDSVYTFTRTYFLELDTLVATLSISAHYPLLIQQEIKNNRGKVLEKEEIMEFSNF